MATFRTLDPDRDAEIDLVAARMRDTLVEVLGPERGGSMYTHDWLVRRVRQHLPGGELTGEVFVAEVEGAICGHAIARLDRDQNGRSIGLLSTIYVVPSSRRSRLASALIGRAEQWMSERDQRAAVTYTHEHNAPLIALMSRLGYALAPMPDQFVALTKRLLRRRGPHSNAGRRE